MAACATDVTPDDVVDGYVADGSLVLDETFDGSAADRQSAAACPGCRWRYLPYCRTTPVPGGWDTCPATASWCPPGSSRVRLLRWTADRPWWETVGSTCVGAGRGPVPVEAVATALRETVLALLPPLRPGSSPAAGTLVGLPTYLSSGQPSRVGPVDLTVLGVPVQLQAVPRWSWDLDDGTVLVTDDPGGPWPAGGVVHRFAAVGSRRITVTTTWAATFTVSGLGPYEVAGPAVTQQAGVLLAVREARAVLVAR